MRDFTLEQYEKLICEIQERKIPFFTVYQWMKEKPVSNGVFIRHDVDRRPNNALNMARLEAKYGVNTTYYFRILPCSFAPSIIEEIESLGHEVGYHYEDLSLAKGNSRKAYELFRINVERMRSHCDLKTIAMHGSPLSPYNNIDLWKSFGYKELGLLDAFLDIDYSGVFYATDSGRTWAETKSNLRDRVEQGLAAAAASTEDLIKFVSETSQTLQLALVAHPERWDDNLLDWSCQWSKDLAVNSVKRALRFFRG